MAAMQEVANPHFADLAAITAQPRAAVISRLYADVWINDRQAADALSYFEGKRNWSHALKYDIHGLACEGRLNWPTRFCASIL